MAVSKQEIRIIGGRFRSRKLRFPDAEGLRPTPDRVRETLFNWLRDSVEGARCLDLYAGSGALGFEAVSRGARRVVMVDAQKAVAQSLKGHCDTLDVPEVGVVFANARDYLKGEAEMFDGVFLDPPFRKGWLPSAGALLERGGWLALNAWIYVEAEREFDFSSLPPAWRCLRQGVAGDLAYRLYQRQSAQDL
jgi:16S rRNA (guanine966-N2)-methyltransferase